MKKYKSFIEFAQDFSTREQCLLHLCELKWSDGYTCRKCGHNVAVKGRTWYYRKCQKCHHDESCTAHTLTVEEVQQWLMPPTGQRERYSKI